MNELISIIIPVYNTESYIERCLSSVINNTYKNVEIICVNDGSTDSSLEVLKRMADLNERIIIISQENQGVSVARNTGLSVAHGSYIGFVDSDDVVSRDYFEKLLSLFSKTECDIAACRYRTFSTDYPDNKQKTDSTLVSMSITQVLEDDYLCCMIWGRLYNRNILEDRWFTKNIPLGEDTIFNLSVLFSKKDIIISVLDDELYYYYERSNSAIHTVNMENWLSVCMYYLEEYKKDSNLIAKQYYLDAGIKRFLSTRYYLGVLGGIQDNLNTINSLQKQYRILLKSQENGWTRMKRQIYFIFIKFPSIYRLYRIVQDRSLLEWENSNKINANR